MIYRTPTGYRVKDVEFSSPGKVKADGQEQSIKNFIKSLESQAKDLPDFKELPILSPPFSYSKFRALNAPSGMCVGKSADDKLVVHVREKDESGKVVARPYEFAPGSVKGTFSFPGEDNLTMSDIIEGLKQKVYLPTGTTPPGAPVQQPPQASVELPKNLGPPAPTELLPPPPPD